MIGKSVRVIIDRPLGSSHPKFSETVYELNYGYVREFMGGDGEEQDAYILGVDEPISSFEGRVIAIIHRLDDIEDKLVVAPEGMDFTREQIIEQTHFQEKYFNSTVEMRRSK